MARNDILAWAVTLGVIAIQGMTLHVAPDWYGDDYASYIHNAEALRQGLPYALPGYQANLAVDAGPGAYPPGYPLMLAAFGTGFQTIGWLNVLCAGIAVRLFIAWAGTTGPAIAAGALIGLSPFVTAFKGVVASEFLFLALILAWLLLEHRRIAAGVVLGLALLTRLAGLPALAAAPLAALLRLRRPGRSLLSPLIATALLAVGLLALTPDLVAHYRANIGANGALGAANPASLPGRMSVIWSYAGQGAQPQMAPWLDMLRKAATLLLLAAGAAGLALRIRNGARPADAFALLSFASLALLPEIMAGPRLFLPLCVMFIAYALDLAAIRKPLGWLVVLLLLTGSAPTWVAMAGAQPNPYTATEPRAVAFLDWLRDQPRGLVLARRARAIAYFTGQPTSDWHQTTADAAFLAWAHARGARLLVFSIDQAESRAAAHGETTPAALNAALDRVEAAFFAGTHFAPAFRNERFRAYLLPTP